MTRVTDIVLQDLRWEPVSLADLSERAVLNVLEFMEFPTEGYEVSILGCDDDRISELNAEFRGKPVATNVLSWPAHDLSAAEDGAEPSTPPAPDPLMGESLGDIAIAYDTCLRESGAAGKSFDDHVTHLIVHAMLHLLGYDHVRDHDATLMEGLETEILGKMGVADPYRE
ncbi:rRNA maturation RNase YbeY [Marivita sp. S2033]|uniref:rRNA maturation RNase YbeY n=1 Tax=Marivita sp. S2033 TaxID=3373187 RepID=UPI003981B573